MLHVLGDSDTSNWFLRRHESQTVGRTSHDVAYCAAYMQEEIDGIDYLVCSLPGSQDYTPHSLPCLYAQGKLNCCRCGKECNLGIGVEQLRVTNQFGVTTDGCRVNTSHLSGTFVCLAQTKFFLPDQLDITRSAPQYLGNFTFAENPTNYQSTLTIPIWTAAAVLSISGFLLLVIILTTVFTSGRYCHRRRHAKQRLLVEGMYVHM